MTFPILLTLFLGLFGLLEVSLKAIGLFAIAAILTILINKGGLEIVSSLRLKEIIQEFQIIHSNISLILYIIFGIILIMLLSIPSKLRDIENGTVLIMLFMFGGYVIAGETETYFNMFLAFEVAAFCSYALIGLDQTKLMAKEAVMKYFIGTSIAGIVFLFGVSILYSLTYTTNISQLADMFIISRNVAFYLGILCIILSMSSKLAIAPFHLFTMDAYQIAPMFVSLFLMTIPKLVLFFILYQIYGQFPSSLFDVCLFVLMLITFIQQIVQAFGQIKLRRFIVFSMTVNNLLLFACLFLASSYDSFTIVPSLVYYFIPLMLLFFILNHSLFFNDTIHNLSLQKNPIIFLGILIFAVSSVGIPIFPGFIQKFLIFFELVTLNTFIIPLITILVTFFVGYLYLRFILITYFTIKFTELFQYLMSQITSKSIGLGTTSVLILSSMLAIFFQIPDLLLASTNSIFHLVSLTVSVHSFPFPNLDFGFVCEQSEDYSRFLIAVGRFVDEYPLQFSKLKMINMEFIQWFQVKENDNSEIRFMQYRLAVPLTSMYDEEYVKRICVIFQKKLDLESFFISKLLTFDPRIRLITLNNVLIIRLPHTETTVTVIEILDQFCYYDHEHKGTRYIIDQCICNTAESALAYLTYDLYKNFSLYNKPVSFENLKNANPLLKAQFATATEVNNIQNLVSDFNIIIVPSLSSSPSIIEWWENPNVISCVKNSLKTITTSDTPNLKLINKMLEDGRQFELAREFCGLSCYLNKDFVKNRFDPCGLRRVLLLTFPYLSPTNRQIIQDHLRKMYIRKLFFVHYCFIYNYSDLSSSLNPKVSKKTGRPYKDLLDFANTFEYWLELIHLKFKPEDDKLVRMRLFQSDYAIIRDVISVFFLRGNLDVTYDKFYDYRNDTCEPMTDSEIFQRLSYLKKVDLDHFFYLVFNLIEDLLLNPPFHLDTKKSKDFVTVKLAPRETEVLDKKITVGYDFKLLRLFRLFNGDSIEKDDFDRQYEYDEYDEYLEYCRVEEDNIEDYSAIRGLQERIYGFTEEDFDEDVDYFKYYKDKDNSEDDEDNSNKD